jgi:hypothetical protein
MPAPAHATSFDLNSGDTLTVDSNGALEVVYGDTGNINEGGQLNNYGTVNNAGWLNSNTGGFLGNFGTLNNNSDGLFVPRNGWLYINSGGLYNEGTLNNNSGGILYNSLGGLYNHGTLNNNSGSNVSISNFGYMDNYGTLNNNSGATMTIDAGYFTNYGIVINNSGASLTNYYSMMTNDTSGTLENYGVFANTGGQGHMLSNYGALNNYSGATLNNNSGAMLVNYSGGTLNNYGTLNNDWTNAELHNQGTLNNYGTLNNTVGAWLYNSGTLTNYGAINSSGSMMNYPGGTLENDGMLKISGGLENDGALTNSGTVNITFYFQGNGTYIQTAGQTTNKASMVQASVDIEGGTFSQQGGALTATGIVNKGTFIAGGAITVSDKFQNYGKLSGNGTIQGVLENHGIVSPGSSPGTMAVIGDYTQDASGSLVLELGGLTQGVQYDLMSITGTANLQGTLEVDLYPKQWG